MAYSKWLDAVADTNDLDAALEREQYCHLWEAVGPILVQVDAANPAAVLHLARPGHWA